MPLRALFVFTVKFVTISIFYFLVVLCKMRSVLRRGYSDRLLLHFQLTDNNEEESEKEKKKKIINGMILDNT
jgi:hypothetical protein